MILEELENEVARLQTVVRSSLKFSHERSPASVLDYGVVTLTFETFCEFSNETDLEAPGTNWSAYGSPDSSIHTPESVIEFGGSRWR